MRRQCKIICNTYLVVLGCLMTMPTLGVSCFDLPAPDDSVPLLNFHVVDPDRAYRSAQPDPEDLRLAIEQLGLRTVINLQGAHSGESWYDDEKAVCDELRVRLIDVPMSPYELPSAEVMAKIVNTLETAEYPILIHCLFGADRTGAVAAIYDMLILGEEKSLALQELSPAMLHFRFLTPCMDHLAESYEPGSDWLIWYAENAARMTCQP